MFMILFAGIIIGMLIQKNSKEPARLPARFIRASEAQRGYWLKLREESEFKRWLRGYSLDPKDDAAYAISLLENEVAESKNQIDELANEVGLLRERD
jgi:hypothetical protein